MDVVSNSQVQYFREPLVVTHFSLSLPEQKLDDFGVHLPKQSFVFGNLESVALINLKDSFVLRLVQKNVLSKFDELVLHILDLDSQPLVFLELLMRVLLQSLLLMLKILPVLTRQVSVSDI